MGAKALLGRVKRSLVGGAAAPSRGVLDRDEGEELRLAREEIEEKNRRLRKLRERLEEKEREIEELRQGRSANEEVAEAERGGVGAENVVWIFCTGRSGSTWLATMLGEMQGNALWDEPLVGALFGEFYYDRAGYKRGAKFIMGPPHRRTWLASIRQTVLDGAAARFPALPGGGYLVVKEPHGSHGAPLLVEALPESRVILLARDPRDVMSSALDAHREGSWISRHRNRRPRKEGEGHNPDTFVESDSDPEGFLANKTEKLARDLGRAKEAYDAHAGPKVLVRYEDLRADTPGTMRLICSTLGIPADEGDLARVVEAHAFEGIPEDKRGEGKFYRKASPGAWREDLTAGQAELVEGVAAPVLDEFYPGWREEPEGRPQDGASS